MQLSEDEIIKKYANQYGHCNRNTLPPYEYEFTCISCGYNVIKRKHDLTKIQRKKMNFINQLKYAEQKLFCILIDVYQIYEGNDFGYIYETLSTLKIKKLKLNKIIIEENKDMIESPDFEHDYRSRTARGVYNVGHDSIRLMRSG